MNTILNKSNRWNEHLSLAVAGFFGIVGLFLPFSYNTSPMQALLMKEVWPLGVPFFLSVFISAAAIRWIISGSFSKVEKTIAYFVGAAAAGVTLSFIFNGDSWPSNFQEWLAFPIPIVVFLSGAYLVFRNFRKQVSRETNPLIAMQVAYLANCLFCLVSFWYNGNNFFSGGWQIGAYFCLAASIVYLIQIVLFSGQKNEIPDQVEVTVA